MIQDDTQRTPPHGDPLRRIIAAARVKVWRISVALAETWTLTTMATAIRQRQQMKRFHGQVPIDVSMAPSIGVGCWGTEPGFTIETATPLDLVPFVRWLLEVNGQLCAYVTVDGMAYEIDKNGAQALITGE